MTKKLNDHYKEIGQKKISGIPDWIVAKYTDGKLTYMKRYIGGCSLETLRNRIKLSGTKNR